MKPAQARSPGPEIQRKWKAAEHDLGAGQQLVALLARTDWSRIMAEVALDRPRRPGLADFDVKPAPSIDHMQASVERRDTTQRFVGYRYNHEDFSGQHHDLFDRRLARPLRPLFECGAFTVHRGRAGASLGGLGLAHDTARWRRGEAIRSPARVLDAVA